MATLSHDEKETVSFQRATVNTVFLIDLSPFFISRPLFTLLPKCFCHINDPHIIRFGPSAANRNTIRQTPDHLKKMREKEKMVYENGSHVIQCSCEMMMTKTAAAAAEAVVTAMIEATANTHRLDD